MGRSGVENVFDIAKRRIKNRQGEKGVLGSESHVRIYGELPPRSARNMMLFSDKDDLRIERSPGASWPGKPTNMDTKEFYEALACDMLLDHVFRLVRPESFHVYSDGKIPVELTQKRAPDGKYTAEKGFSRQVYKAVSDDCSEYPARQMLEKLREIKREIQSSFTVEDGSVWFPEETQSGFPLGLFVRELVEDPNVMLQNDERLISALGKESRGLRGHELREKTQVYVDLPKGKTYKTIHGKELQGKVHLDDIQTYIYRDAQLVKSEDSDELDKIKYDHSCRSRKMSMQDAKEIELALGIDFSNGKKF